MEPDHPASLVGREQAVDERYEAGPTDGMNPGAIVAAAIEKHGFTWGPELSKDCVASGRSLEAVAMGIGGIVETVGKRGHGEVFTHSEDRCIDGKDCAAVAGVVGEGGIVVGTGLHGVVPEPETPPRIELGALAIRKDALHSWPDGAEPGVVVQVL